MEDFSFDVLEIPVIVAELDGEFFLYYCDHGEYGFVCNDIVAACVGAQEIWLGWTSMCNSLSSGFM